jgi:hypothetical protein
MTELALAADSAIWEYQTCWNGHVMDLYMYKMLPYYLGRFDSTYVNFRNVDAFNF